MENTGIESRHVTPCTHGEIPFCNYRYSGQKMGDLWCMKWRMKRDRAEIIYGCNSDFPKHFL